MRVLRIALIGLAFFAVLSVAQHAWYWSQLPERVATHFGADGIPNDWMSRTAATVLLLAIQIGLPVFLLGIAWFLPSMPNSTINIPHREYWLAPERRAHSLDHMRTMLAWIAGLSALEIASMSHLAYVANRSDGTLNTLYFGIVLVIYLAAVFAIAGKSMWHFRLPRQAQTY